MIYRSSIVTHIKNCETCTLACKPIAMCNAGFEMFVYWENRLSISRGPQPEFDIIKKNIAEGLPANY